MRHPGGCRFVYLVFSFVFRIWKIFCVRRGMTRVMKGWYCVSASGSLLGSKSFAATDMPSNEESVDVASHY